MIYIVNKCCTFELSSLQRIYQYISISRFPQKYEATSTTVFSTDNNK